MAEVLHSPAAPEYISYEIFRGGVSWYHAENHGNHTPFPRRAESLSRYNMKM